MAVAKATAASEIALATGLGVTAVVLEVAVNKFTCSIGVK